MKRNLIQMISMVLACCFVTEGGVVRLPWHDPCGGQNTVPGTEGQGGTGNGSVDEALGRIATSAAEAVHQALRLKTLYNNGSDNARLSDSAVHMIVSTHFDNFPVERPIEGATLQRDYDEVSTIAVFMENVRLNEEASTFVTKFTAEMKDFETSLYQNLCKIKLAADAKSENIEFNIQRNVMKSMYRDVPNASYRYMRDYIVFRDAQVFLEALSNAY